jgi:hypothetical protein
MKKQFTAISLVGMGLAGSLCAQSLYDLAPDDTETDSLPLTWTAGANVGYDDNPVPFSGNDDSALYGQAYVGAAFLTNTPQSTMSFGAQVGVIHYFDNLDFGTTEVDDTSFTASAYLNWTHRVSERLRFVSRNRVNYELEPDYSTGFQSSRQIGNYFTYSTDNAIGYRWSERLATYTGIRFDGITYDDFANADRSTWTLYNDFRYQLSERTVATLSYRYSETTGDGQVSDSTNHYILAGLEHRFSSTTTGIIRAGVQLRDVDGGSNGSSPYLEASLRSQVTQQFGLRAYARYGTEDYGRSLSDGINTTVYSGTESLRVGFTADYQVSQALGLIAGVNYAMQSYQDPTYFAGTLIPDSDEDLLNAFVGFNLNMTDNLVFNGRYNFETLGSDVSGRDYDRNRFSLGVSTTF